MALTPFIPRAATRSDFGRLHRLPPSHNLPIHSSQLPKYHPYLPMSVRSQDQEIHAPCSSEIISSHTQHFSPTLDCLLGRGALREFVLLLHLKLTRISQPSTLRKDVRI